MKKQTIVLGLFAALTMTACEREFKGSIALSSPLQVKQKKGIAVIPAGAFALELDVESKKEIELKIKTPAGKKEIKIKSSSDLLLPKEGGRVVISGAQTGQTFDIVGEVDHRVDESADRFRVESCSEVLSRRVCRVDINGVESCATESITVPGQREVRYHTRTETRLLSAQLINRADGAVIGDMDGANRASEEIVTGRSGCRLNRGGIGVL